MHPHYDYAVLVTQLFRSVVWVAGCFYALRFRRVLLTVGCGCAVFTSTVYAFANSHFAVPQPLLETSNYLSLFTVVMVVASLILGTKLYSRRKHWTP